MDGPVTRSMRPADERFWAKVDKTAGCWIWRGCVLQSGYGQFWDGGRPVRAHRWAYEATIGAIPSRLHLDHLCRVRRCVNPDHLEPVTGSENKQRAVRDAPRTHCRHGHEYTPENVYMHNGYCHCRACRRDCMARFLAGG